MKSKCFINIYYKIEILPKLIDESNSDDYEKYKFKDLGYLNLYYNKTNSKRWSWHGFITVEELKQIIGQKQYSKFCQGKREFIIQKTNKK